MRRIDDLYRFYDANGNLVLVSTDAAGASPAGARQRLSYDAWNRLTKAQKLGASGWSWNEYAYNGLNWKVREKRSLDNPSGTETQLQLLIEQSGTSKGDGDGGVENLQVTTQAATTPPSSGEVLRWTFYSLAWQQMLEVTGHPGTATTPATVLSQEQQFWGARGVDDAVLRRKDANGNSVYDEAGDSGYYQLTDSSFSVICHVDSTSGVVRQWMSYDGYGNVKVLRPADFDGDGTVTTQDQTQFNAAYNAVPAALPSADFNGDGTVDSTDADGFNAAYAAAGLTLADEVRIGYAGYVRDPLTEFLLARNRWYEPGAGRWVTRDPAGYVDGLSLYLYAKGNPLSLVDPTGLLGQPPGLLQRIANFFSLSGGQSPSSSDDSTPAAVESVQQAGKVLDAADSIVAPLAEAAAAARPYAEAAGSMVPGVGEMMDAWTVVSPESSLFDRAAAVGSLGVNALTAGLAPNYTGIKGVGKIVGPKVEQELVKIGDEVAEGLAKQLGKHGDELVDAAGKAKGGATKFQQMTVGGKHIYDPGPRPSTDAMRTDWGRANPGQNWPIDPATGKPKIADHVVPRSNGGKDVGENIQPLTPTEHLEKHREDFKEMGSRRRN